MTIHLQFGQGRSHTLSGADALRPDARRSAQRADVTLAEGASVVEQFGALLLARDALRDGAEIQWSGPRTTLEHVRGLAGEIGLEVTAEGFRVLPRPRWTQPLVSILVPAYRPDWLGPCLDSAFAQTYDPIEVIVADDGVDEGVAEAVAAHPRAADIELIQGPNHRAPDDSSRKSRPTMLWLEDAARGPYIKFLNDDDTLEPTCVAKLASVLDAFPHVTLATSHRHLIDATGDVRPSMETTSHIVPEDAILDGRATASAIVRTGWNFLGEPSTAMYRHADAKLSQPDVLSLGGRVSPGNVDMHLWAALGLRGDIAYLASSLSSLRIHPAQMQNSQVGIARGQAALANLTDLYETTGLFTDAASVNPTPLGARPWWPEDVLVALASVADAPESLVDAAAIIRADGDVAALMELAAHARQAGALNICAEIVQAALESAPLHPGVRLEMARLQLAAGNMDAARRAGADVRRLCPRSRTVHDALLSLGI